MKSLLRPLLRIFGKYIPSDLLAKKYPVSIKGIIAYEDKLILLKNERNEWELPGGKIDPGESPEECLAREIQEELGLEVQVGPPVYAWMYHILKRVRVFVVAYDCALLTPSPPQVVISNEHQGFDWFARNQLEGLNLPQGYREAIRKWTDRPESTMDQGK